MTQIDRIQDYLQRLTPFARSNLLSELERLELCGVDMPRSVTILEKLRAEFRDGSQAANRIGNPSRYFFEPLELLLVDGAPQHANTGRIIRGSLAAIWQWINRELLPTMARDYVSVVSDQIAANNQLEARKTAVAFQTKIFKCLENLLRSQEGVRRIQAELATYTASQTAYSDLTKILCVLRARDALAKFNGSLPATIEKFEGSRISKIIALLDGLGKSHSEAIPFALALVATRLRVPWQLIRIATKAAPSKNAADIAATPYAIVVSMVLDGMEDDQSALRVALKNNRVLVARNILTRIYDAEYALRVRIDLLAETDWGKRLEELMKSVAAQVETEVSRLPSDVDHVLHSRSLRSYQSLVGRLTYLTWKGRDALSNAAASCRNLISHS